MLYSVYVKIYVRIASALIYIYIYIYISLVQCFLENCYLIWAVGNNYNPDIKGNQTI